MSVSLMQMRDIILEDWYHWYSRGINTGYWSQKGVLYMRAEAGVGKSEIVFQISEIIAKGYRDLPPLPHCRVPVQVFWNASMDPESIAGCSVPANMKIRIPNPNFDAKAKESDSNPRTIQKDMRALVMHYRYELLKAQAGGPGPICFNDEMGRDAPHMRAAQLKFLSPEKTLAGLDCSNFYTLAAGNTADEHHKVDDIMADDAMARRLLPFHVEASVSEWADYMFAKARQYQNPTYKVVAEFILDNPTYIKGRDNDDDAASATRNPASLEFVAEKLHFHGGGTMEQHGRMDNQAAIGMVFAAIGADAGTQLEAYINQNRPMNVQAILAGKFTVGTDGRLADGCFPSVVRNLQDWLQNETLDTKKNQAKNVARFLGGVGADITHSITRDNTRILPENTALLASEGVFNEVLDRVKNLGTYTV